MGVDPNEPHAVTDRWIFSLSAACALTALLFITFPKIDIAVSALFASPHGGFPLARHPVLKWLNRLVEYIAITGIVLLPMLLAVGLVWKRSIFARHIRQVLFLALSLALGPGLVANSLFKNLWGRARPRDIVEFGGTLTFTPPVLVAHQCDTNCSFVSGDTSLAFSLLAVALVLPKGWRRPGVVLVLLFGILIGFTRMVQGAHFLSDTVFAGLFMTLVIVVLYRLILEPLPDFSRYGRKAVSLMRSLAGRDTPANRKGLSLPPPARAGWRGILWLAFRSRPEDFGVPPLCNEDKESRDGLEAPVSAPSAVRDS